MFKIDQAIKDTSAVICKNIARFDSSERGLLSQNILGQLRNFVEYIISKIIHHPNDVDPNNFGLKEQAISQIKTMGQFIIISNLWSLIKFGTLVFYNCSKNTQNLKREICLETI